jgi:hypothetical protein
MTFGARGGGFGSIGQGPFRTGQGGFGQYLIGDDGANLDALRKQKAQIQWSNGTITDSQYLSELSWYLGRQEKGTSQFLSAQDDLQDARYSIGRNRIVNAVNRSASTADRIANLTKLIRWDQRRARGMRGDNEQARELRERISDAEAQIRDARYGDEVRRFNDNRRSTEQMLRYARRMAAESRGSADAQQWADRVSEWEDRRWDEDFEDAKVAYTKARSSTNGDIRGTGNVVIQMLQSRLSGMSQDSPGYKQYQRALRDQRATIEEDVWARRASNMRVALDEGQASEEDYIAFLYERSQSLPKGSTARQQARSEFLSETFRLGEARIENGIRSGELEADAAVDFYQGYLATMQPTAQKYSEIMEKIRGYRLAAVESVPFTAPGAGKGGRRIAPSGGKGGVGFVSQYDGSAFATQNCIFASSAMMIDALGGPNISGADLRRYAGDPDGAGFQSDVQAAYESLGFAVDRYNGMGFKRFTKQLDAHDGGAVVIGLLSMLPQEFRISGSGAHAVYVTEQKKVVNGETYRLVMDPLGRQGYRGDWWPDSVLQRFAWNGVKNPLSGNAVYGSVVFGKRTGRSNVAYTPRGKGYTPRFQAFDTDADGRSTVGRGGGTSRQEAGAPTDWRKGRGGKPAGRRGGATTDTDTVAFLDAVGNVEAGLNNGRRLPLSVADEKNRKDRASAILAEYKGDVRLATLAWFGRTPDPNTELWDANDRWYVNSVATRLGYDKVPPQGIGIIEPGAPIAPKPSGADVIPGLEASVGAAQGGRRKDTASDVQPAAGDVAITLAERLGIPPNESMIRAIIGWMATDNGNAELEAITGNNPFGIETVGQRDLPGQIGVDQNGRAIFASMEDGIDAVAAELEREFPDVVAAGRTGDPKKFLTTLDKSAWREGGYGGALVPAYNQQPGDDTMVNGGGVLDVPPNLGQMAGQHSDVADLFDIDPRDPAQMAWLDRNIDAAKRAFDAGAAKWDFVPLAGEPVQLDFAADMYAQLLGTKATYVRIDADLTPSAGERSQKRLAADRLADQALAAGGEIAMDDIDRDIESLRLMQDDAMRTGDYPLAANAAMSILRKVGLVLGVPPGTVIDVDAARGNIPGWTDAEYDHLSDIVDSVDPESPTGDPFLKLVQDDRVVIEMDAQGNVSSMTIPPEVAFVTQKPNGDMQIVTDKTAPDEFAPVTQYDQQGNASQVPAYTLSRVFTVIPEADGTPAQVWLARESGQVPAAVFDFAGYRPPVKPTTPDQGGGGMLEGTVADSIGDLWGSSVIAGVTNAVGSIFGNGIQQAPPAANPTAPPRTVTARQPWDAVKRTFASQLPVDRVTYIDPISGKTVDLYSVDDGKTWIGGERDKLADAPPMLVLNPDSGVTVGGTLDEPTFKVAGKDYTIDTLPGGISSVFHWYGTDPKDNPNPYAAPEVGAPGRTNMRLYSGTPAAGGGVQITVQETRDPRTLAYENSARVGSAALSNAMRKHDYSIVDRVLAAGGGKAEATAALTASYTSAAPGSVPTVDYPRSGMAWIQTAGRTATGASANANQTAAKAMAARAVLAAKERTAAVARRNALVARQRTSPVVKATPRPTPTPVGSAAPSAAPRRTRTPNPTGYVPRPKTSTSTSSTSSGGGLSSLSIVNRQQQAKPKASPSPGPRRE